jgi:uncharacterized protein YjiK
VILCGENDFILMEIIKNRIPVIFQYQILFLFIISCGSSPQKTDSRPDTASINTIGYDLNNPDKTFVMPAVLNEISGITVIDTSTVACIQDENGIVFLYDVRGKGIVNRISFRKNGDFEGIANVNGTIYVLRSDGTLFKVKNFDSSEPAEEIRLKELPHNDYEGLCYDRKNNRLLIAPKEKIDDSHKKGIKHGIYGFDLNQDVRVMDPVITFDLSAINKFIAENNAFSGSEAGKKDKGNKLKTDFHPSEICIHPITGKLFVLSSIDSILFVFNTDGTIEHIFRLNPEIFTMPEGLTFFENGDMLVSNEGQRGMPSLLRFNYKNQ